MNIFLVQFAPDSNHDRVTSWGPWVVYEGKCGCFAWLVVVVDLDKPFMARIVIHGHRQVIEYKVLIWPLDASTEPEPSTYAAAKAYTCCREKARALSKVDMVLDMMSLAWMMKWLYQRLF
ncbi:hypothetical protein GQ457_14G001350 [Hibiscus cannabinus]